MVSSLVGETVFVGGIERVLEIGSDTVSDGDVDDD